MTNLILEAATIVRNGRPLFRPLDLCVRPGRPVSVTGPSGSGKSSLLSWITGVLPPPLVGGGRVLLDEKVLNGLPAHRRRVGILFQDDLLFPHLSVGENLAFGLAPGQPRERVGQALGIAGLEGFEDRDPAQLSGGERARVALMRCLLSDPLALLLDEPFSKLDPARRAQMRGFVFHHARKLPILLVSHDPADRAPDGEIAELVPIPGATENEPWPSGYF
jgi:putative thiamine transport system ATP-binding protein